MIRLEAAPAPAHAEVACRRAWRRCLFRNGLQHDGEETGGCREQVSQPVPALEPGSAPDDHFAHFGARVPLGDRDSAGLMAREPQRQRAQTAKPSIVCRSGDPMSFHAGIAGSSFVREDQGRAARPSGCRWLRRGMHRLPRQRRGRTRQPERRVAHELPRITTAPRRCATSAIAGRSRTSKLSDPGDSVKIDRRPGGTRSIAAPASGSPVVVSLRRRRGAGGCCSAASTIHRIGDEHVVALLASASGMSSPSALTAPQ